MPTPNSRNQAIIAEFRANAGKVGGCFTSKRLLLLHTIGAKSGEERINPVAYIADGDRLVLIASKGGSPTSPVLIPQPQGESACHSGGWRSAVSGSRKGRG